MTPEARAATLRECAAFAKLPAEVLARLAAAAEPLTITAGEPLIRQGERASELYVLVSGELEVCRQRGSSEVVIDRLHDDRIVLGEMQALAGGLRTATVRAVTDARVLRIEREAFEAGIEAEPELLAHFARISHDRVRRHQLQAALRVEDDEGALMLAVCERVEWMQLERGDRLVEQGERSDAIFFMLRGRLECVIEDEAGHSQRVSDILPGESFGETAVIADQTRGATVWAAAPSEVARLGREDYMQLSAAHPSLMRRTLEVVVERQSRRRRRRRRPTAHTIVLVPLSEGVPMAELVPALMTELEAITTALRVDRNTIAARLGDPELADLDPSDPRCLRIEMLMDELEGAVEHLVYQVDRLDSGWARRCLQMADEIVLVGLAGDSARPTRIERRLLQVEPDFLRPHTTLAIVHSGSSRPTGTQAWLRGREIDAVHHLRRHEPGDIARLARVCAGQAVGLVLSGGAARSFAGFGMIEAMVELGIPIDALGGVSAGALVAAIWAAGISTETFMERLLSAKSVFRMLELNVPIVSVSSARGVESQLRELFGSAHFEDLWLPCFCVSTNLSQARQRVSARGPLVESLMATNAMPGVFPPVEIDGDLHVDGAFLNNVPIAEMDALVRGGPIVTLDVTPSVEFERRSASADRGLGSWRVLRDKLRGKGEFAREPTSFELLMRAQLVHHVAHIREVKPLADLYLQPALDEFGLAQHYRARAIARAGHQRTRASLQAWWAGRAGEGETS